VVRVVRVLLWRVVCSVSGTPYHSLAHTHTSVGEMWLLFHGLSSVLLQDISAALSQFFFCGHAVWVNERGQLRERVAVRQGKLTSQARL
jgi:hypothetical protein